MYIHFHYSCVCDVCREWGNEVGFFLKIPVWLVCYAHVFHVYNVDVCVVPDCAYSDFSWSWVDYIRYSV